MTMTVWKLACAAVAAAGSSCAASRPAHAAQAESDSAQSDKDTFDDQEIVKAASDFFGVTTEAVAKAVESVFKSKGRPNAYIIGEEGSGALVVGLRYGEGDLYRKNQAAPTKVYWQGPSV